MSRWIKLIGGGRTSLLAPIASSFVSSLWSSWLLAYSEISYRSIKSAASASSCMFMFSINMVIIVPIASTFFPFASIYWLVACIISSCSFCFCWASDRSLALILYKTLKLVSNSSRACPSSSSNLALIEETSWTIFSNCYSWLYFKVASMSVIVALNGYRARMQWSSAVAALAVRTYSLISLIMFIFSSVVMGYLSFKTYPLWSSRWPSWFTTIFVFSTFRRDYCFWTAGDGWVS